MTIDTTLAAETTLAIINKRGLHARAAAKMSKLATQFKCETMVCRADIQADAHSILDLLMLGAAQGKTIQVKCFGPEAQEALAAISALVKQGFDEEDDDGC